MDLKNCNVPWSIYLLIAPELLRIPAKRICPESCFFVFMSIRVPMIHAYVICTRERHNISLIEDQLGPEFGLNVVEIS